MSGTQRKRYSPQEREQFLELWKSSGLSQLAFSRQHQIPAPLLYSWIYKSKKKKLKLKFLPQSLMF